MRVSKRQFAALAAICDTFVSGGAGVPSASALGVPEAVVEAIGRNPRASEVRQVRQLLSLWNSRALTAIGGGGLRRFADLALAERERVLVSWADSRLLQRRTAFLSLRRAALAFYYGMGADGERNPAWDAIGYPGPLGPPTNPRAPALEPIEPGSDMTLECDVVVVGSGAGGGPAAAILAESGFDVIVVEAGGYHDDRDFDGSERTALARFFAGSPPATADGGIALLQGECVGGGTVVNLTTSFRTPDDVREEWASHGVPAFTGEDYDKSLDAVCDRMSVNLEHTIPSSRDRLLEQACNTLGWHVERIPRNVRGCDERECGWCAMGCRRGAKQSSAKTWLVDAQRAGARLLIRTRVDRVITQRGVARGVEGRTAAGHAVKIRCRAVVAAGGSLQTPALLKRSGLANPNIGRHLKLHPYTLVFGVFDEELRPWEGTLQASYSDEHRFLDGGYGVKYETAPLHPSVLGTFVAWRSADQHWNTMRTLAHTSTVVCLLRDRDGGEVRVGRDGHPMVHYRLSAYDTSHLRTGYKGAARLLETAGARLIHGSHPAGASYEPGNGGLQRFIADCDRAGWAPGQVTLGSVHLMASARMGGSPATSACDPTGQTWDVRNLYVCDAATFPTSSGTNPMISIAAIAHMNARQIAAALA